MEIDVTHMVEDADNMPTLSGSRAEWGEGAGKLTWNNSVEYGTAHPLLTTDEQREAARKHFAEYGAWSREDIAAWSEDHLQGITCQDVAAAIREMEHAETYEEFQAGVERGTYSGRLSRGNDEHGDHRWYFYLGS
jgi:hypothetical protein